MVILTNEIKDSLAAAKFAWLATATKDGTPNVVVVAAVRLLDDESLLISDQFFLKTLANLKENPKVAVFWLRSLSPALADNVGKRSARV